jgi:hypothetical protein
MMSINECVRSNATDFEEVMIGLARAKASEDNQMTDGASAKGKARGGDVTLQATAGSKVPVNDLVKGTKDNLKLNCFKIIGMSIMGESTHFAREEECALEAKLVIVQSPSQPSAIKANLFAPPTEEKLLDMGVDEDSSDPMNASDLVVDDMMMILVLGSQEISMQDMPPTSTNDPCACTTKSKTSGGNPGSHW